MFAYKTCDLDHFTKSIKYEKNHETQFSTNQILKDEIKKKINHTKETKRRKSNEKQKKKCEPTLTHQTHGLGHKIVII